jgi:hypothetical protein
MGVGNGNGIEAPDAAEPEERRDNIVSDIEIAPVSVGIGCIGAAGADDPACVDEQGFTVGRYDENRVALADVNR